MSNKSMTDSVKDTLKNFYTHNGTDKVALNELKELSEQAKFIENEAAVVYCIKKAIQKQATPEYHQYDVNDILVYAVQHGSVLGTKWALEHGANPIYIPDDSSYDTRKVHFLNNVKDSAITLAKQHNNTAIYNLLIKSGETENLEYLSKVDGLSETLKKLYDSEFKDEVAKNEFNNMHNGTSTIISQYELASHIHEYTKNPDLLSLNEILISATKHNSLPAVKFALQNGADPYFDPSPYSDNLHILNKDLFPRAAVIAAVSNENIDFLRLFTTDKDAFSRPITDGRERYSNLLAYASLHGYGNDECFDFVLSHSSKEDIQNLYRAEETNQVVNGKMVNEKQTFSVLQSLCGATYSDYETSLTNHRVAALLDAGCDINQRNAQSYTAMQIAVWNRNLTTIIELQKRGCSLSQPYADGISCYDELFNTDGTYKDFDYQNHKKGEKPESLSSEIDPLYGKSPRERAQITINKMENLLKEVYDLHIAQNQQTRNITKLCNHER